MKKNKLLENVSYVAGQMIGIGLLALLLVLIFKGIYLVVAG